MFCVLKVFEDSKTEMIVTRHSQFIKAINVINIYGEQECRVGRREIEESWNEVLEVLSMIKNRGESAIVLGDLNKLVGDIVPGNHEKISFGGELERELLKNEDYILVNATELAVGGPFTRYEPNDEKNEDKKSCLDLVIVSVELMVYLKSIQIDKNLRFTPGYSVGSMMKYTDHYGILLEFKYSTDNIT